MEEHLNFNNAVIWKLSDNVWITESIYNTWWIMFVLIILAIVVRVKLKSFSDKPTGFQNVVEFAVESMDNFVKGTMGEKNAYFGNWFFGVFAFILFSNLSALFGIRPPTTDLATTVALGLVTFLLIHIVGIATSKGHYFKEYLEPMPLFLPIHLVEVIATPISLSFRLFGIILGGYIIMEMIYELFPWFLKIGLPVPLHFYFDIFAGSLQAFIFTILSMTFIRARMPE